MEVFFGFQCGQRLTKDNQTLKCDQNQCFRSNEADSEARQSCDSSGLRVLHILVGVFVLCREAIFEIQMQSLQIRGLGLRNITHRYPVCMNNKSTCTACKAAEDLNSSPYFNTDRLCGAGYPENTVKHLFIQSKHNKLQILDTWRESVEK